MGEASGTAELLQDAEPPALYETKQVHLQSQGRDVLVVSDLHLGPGRGPDGTYPGTENFFADAAFARFIAHASSRTQAHKAILVLNGDVLDFFRVDTVPATQSELHQWQATLASLGIAKTIDELRASIDKKEKLYGLKTHDFKSVWKLDRIVAGHVEAFDALASWVSAGHMVAFVKGNHDLDLFWRPVRDLLRLRVAEHLGRARQMKTEDALRHVLPLMVFVDKRLVIDGAVAIEHGHPYDKFSHVVGGALRPGGAELNLPFGSFFNRYLLNPLERVYPYLDNIRPRENLLPLLIRERFPLALNVLFRHIPFMFLMIPKHYYRYMLRRFLTVAVAALIPVGLFLWQEGAAVSQWIASTQPPRDSATGGTLTGFFLDGVKNLAWLVLSYFLARLVAYFHLDEANSLNDAGLALLHAHPEYRVVVFGHTHNPDQLEWQGRWFYNTGTWVPIVETTVGELREDRCYTFLHLRSGTGGALKPGVLERWNDDAGRGERLAVVRRR